MKRYTSTPRLDWQKRVTEAGLTFHTIGGNTYWDESVHYSFTRAEVDIVEQATNLLHEMCLNAVQFVIDNNRFADLGIPAEVVPLIIDSWEAEPPAIYGRFDLVYDGTGHPKMLEYNADTPTSLLEASVIQWHWIEDKHGVYDQFNSIHEKLIAKWTELRQYVTGETLYFGYIGTEEDIMTVAYMQDTASQAGFRTKAIKMGEIGWDKKEKCFVDPEGNKITSIFKLYPWEWLIHEEFGPQLIATAKEMQWIEPIWKMILSNKGILPILWEMYPGHPNLLPAYFDGPRDLENYVTKPLLSREGSNVTILRKGKVVEAQDGEYGDGKLIYQAEAKIPCFNGKYPIIGSWVIDGESAGMGIRESDSIITGNLSRFVPHVFY